MADNLLPGRYAVGAASVDAGGTVVTPTGATWTDNVWGDDLFFLPSQPLVPPQRVESVNEDGELVLAYPWPGAAATEEPYEVRYVGIIERSTAQSRRVLEQLGDVKAWYDIIVVDDGSRLALETESSPLRAGYRVLVKDDGAIWAKKSSAYGDWIGPVEFKGDIGNKGWSPVHGIVVDGARRVWRLTEWVGGEGAPPAGAGKYVGPTGLVDEMAAATDVRGPAGDIGGLSSFWQERVTTDTNAAAARAGLGAGVVDEIVPGAGVSIDDTDPQSPVISVDMPDLNGLPPSIAFNRENILGEVSELYGIPTGALIQSGSNANGRYQRFADGLQICSRRFEATGVAPTAYGEGSIANGAFADRTWTFPLPFAAAPRHLVTHSLTKTGAGNRVFAGASSFSATKTAATTRFWCVATFDYVSANELAHGEWFDVNILWRDTPLLSSDQAGAAIQAAPPAGGNIWIRINCIPYNVDYSVTYASDAAAGRIVALDAGAGAQFAGINARGVTISQGQTITFRRTAKNSFTVVSPASPTARSGDGNFALSPQRVLIVGQSLGQQWEYMPAAPNFIRVNNAASTEFYHQCTGGSAAMHEYVQSAYPTYWWYDLDTSTDGPLLTAVGAFIDSLGPTLKPTHILWVQGEQDAGTYAGTTSGQDAAFVAKYKATVAAILAKLQAKCNPSSPLTVPAYVQILGRRLSGDVRGMPLVRQAQYELVETSGLNIRIGAVPPADLPHADDVHPSAAGYAILGTLTGQAFKA